MKRPALVGAARLLLLAGVVALGCNSLVGNDTHELGPSNNGGAPGAKGGTGAGGPAAGGSNGGTVATGGVPAGGGPGVGGAVGSGGVATGGATVNGGAAGGGHTGSGGVVGTGGAGTAGAGGMCIAPGSACTASSSCCQSGSTSPMGAVCISDDGICHAKCMDGSQCVKGCCAPVTGETYGVCADPAIYCPLKGVGDPCSANSECASGSCNAWCQAPCSAADSICSSTDSNLDNSQDQPNWCIFTKASTYSCFPGCDVTADCAVYGASYTCQTFTDVDGLTDSVCSL